MWSFLLEKLTFPSTLLWMVLLEKLTFPTKGMDGNVEKTNKKVPITIYTITNIQYNNNIYNYEDTYGVFKKGMMYL